MIETDGKYLWLPTLRMRNAAENLELCICGSFIAYGNAI